MVPPRVAILLALVHDEGGEASAGDADWGEIAMFIARSFWKQFYFLSQCGNRVCTSRESCSAFGRPRPLFRHGRSQLTARGSRGSCLQLVAPGSWGDAREAEKGEAEREREGRGGGGDSGGSKDFG
jgi:hypothetical protein